MAQELIHTSAPRGLRVGSSGFCTVACTRGMAPNYVELLESLSGYAVVFPLHDPKVGLNPVAFSHYTFTLGGKPVNILSRVAFAGVDYTQRSNKLAYHLVLDAKERAPGGPAWVLQQKGVVITEWNGEPQYLDRTKRIPVGDSSPAPCDLWQRYTGDAGWAGVLAQSFLDDPRQPSFTIFEPGMDTLAVVAEALRLIPPELRWNVTFSTYITSLSFGTSCAWRCCLESSAALKQARRMRGALVLNLTAGADQPEEARRRMAEGSPLIACARDGTSPPELPLTPRETVEESVKIAPRATRKLVRVPQAPETPGPDEWPEGLLEPPRPTPPRRTVALVALAVVLLLSLAFNFYFALGRRGRTRQGETVAPLGGTEVAKAPEPPEQGPLGQAGDELEGPSPAHGVADAQQEVEEKEAEAEKARREAEAERARREAEAEKARREAEQGAADAVKATTRFVVHIAAGEYGLAGKIIRGDGRQYIVPLAGVTKEWRVRKVGRWGGGEQAAIIPEKPLDNGIQLMGKDAGTGAGMPVVSIKPDDAGLLFTKEERAKGPQLEACLGDVSWIELDCRPEKKTVFVVTKALERTIQIKRAGRREEAHGEIALPSPLGEVFKENEDKLKCPESLTDTGKYTAQVAYTLNGSDLTVGIGYSYETPPGVLRAAEALRAAEQELQPARAKLNDAERIVSDAAAAFRRVREPVRRAESARDKALAEYNMRVERLNGARTNLAKSDEEYKKAKAKSPARQRALEKKQEFQRQIDQERPAEAAAWNTLRERQKELREARDEHGERIRAAREVVTKANNHAKPIRKRETEAAGDVKKAEEDLAKRRREEKQKQERAFGQFRGSLEFSLGDEVIAKFKLEFKKPAEAPRRQGRRTTVPRPRQKPSGAVDHPVF